MRAATLAATAAAAVTVAVSTEASIHWSDYSKLRPPQSKQAYTQRERKTPAKYNSVGNSEYSQYKICLHMHVSHGCML